MNDHRKDRKPGFPVEVVSEAAEIMSAFNVLFETSGSHIMNVVAFRVTDRDDNEYLLSIDFDTEQAEYILVIAP